MSSQPSLLSVRENERLELAAAGAWTARHASTLEHLVDTAVRDLEDARLLALDLSGVRALDTFGAWLLERIAREGRARGKETRLTGVAGAISGPARGGADRQSHRSRSSRQGRASSLQASRLWDARWWSWDASSSPSSTCWERSASRSSTRCGGRRSFRLTSAVHHLDRVAWQAVPIILLITFLIGCIIAQQGIFHFRKFGADLYVVDMVGILVLREIGVLIVAIMVAGRSGSSYTAELGSMKMREEVDALRTMGLDPVEILILPRVVALILGLPILAFIGSLSALYGAGLVAWFYGGMSPEIFIDRLKEAISVTHFKVGMIKAPFMALVIGVVAASEGLRVKGSAELLGLQTTTAVVKSIFFVIVLDGVFAIFFASIGM